MAVAALSLIQVSLIAASQYGGNRIDPGNPGCCRTPSGDFGTQEKIIRIEHNWTLLHGQLSPICASLKSEVMAQVTKPDNMTPTDRRTFPVLNQICNWRPFSIWSSIFAAARLWLGGSSAYTAQLKHASIRETIKG